MTTFHFGILCGKTNLSNTIKQKTEKKQTNEHNLKGKASFYGYRYKETRKTANGEKFNKDEYAAAHNTLPFGTKVKVTNTTNGKSVIVRINDRGPFKPGRVIDVTPKAAKELDMINDGIISCELEIVSLPGVNENLKKNYN